MSQIENTEADKNADMLPPEYQRVAIEDPLLECLVILAKESGRRTSVAALSTGLPLSKEGFASPALFVRAAERVRMSTRLVRRPLADVVDSPGLPCILVLNNRQACILRSYSAEEGCTLLFPETPKSETVMSLEELEKKFKGFSFFVRAQANVDDRAGPRAIDPNKDWFWGVIKFHKRLYQQVMLAALMINLFALVSPIFVMNVYDRVLPNNALDTLWVLAGGAAAAMIFDFILKNLRTHFIDAAGRKSDIRISANIFEHIQGLKMEARPPSSGMLADNMREFETLRDFFTSATVVTLIDLPFVLIFVFLIYLIGGPVVAVPLFFMVVIMAVGFVLQKPLAKIADENSREGAYKSSLLIETLNGLETIKIQAAEGHNQRKWEEIVEQSSLTSVRSRAISSFGVSFTGLAAALTSIGVVVYGAQLVGTGDLTAGALIACVILSGRVIAPLSQVASILTRFNQSRSALNRLNDLMALPVEREVDQPFVSKTEFKGKIVFRDVSFRYPNQTSDTLTKIMMEIEPGDRVGIIGAVGSGKTTLQRLVMNLYQPSQGSVEIDGMDVRQIEPGDLRRHIGVAQQDSYLFYGSIRDNIIMGHESVSDEAVARAAELAGINEFLRDSSMGLDTQVGERGALLSGGQRQSVAIARALLYDPPILILDEPTASIDPKSERMLYRKLAKICENKTVMLITHRSTLLGLVDKLALMDKGRLVDYGPRNKIVEDLQAKKYNPIAEGED